jgi:hypothetical protein
MGVNGLATELKKLRADASVILDWAGLPGFTEDDRGIVQFLLPQADEAEVEAFLLESWRVALRSSREVGTPAGRLMSMAIVRHYLSGAGGGSRRRRLTPPRRKKRSRFQS